MTNALFLTVLGIDPMLVITSDFECTCGACMKCQANIRMLDHKLNVAGYRMRTHLKTFAAHLYAGLSAEERLSRLRHAQDCWKRKLPL